VTGDRADGANGISAKPDQVTRVVRHGSVVFGGRVYAHVNLVAYEGRRVVLQRIGEDRRPLHVPVDGSGGCHARDQIAAAEAVNDLGGVFGDISCRRTRPAEDQ